MPRSMMKESQRVGVNPSISEGGGSILLSQRVGGQSFLGREFLLRSYTTKKAGIPHKSPFQEGPSMACGSHTKPGAGNLYPQRRYMGVSKN